MLKSPSPNQILEESVIFGSIGLVLFVGRLWSRAILRQSWKKLQKDDYTMIATFCCYVSLLALLNVSCRYATNEFQPGELPGILADPHDVANRIYGSKITIGVEQSYLMTLWGVKACLLMLYYQMTRDTDNNKWVRIVIVYTVVGIIAIEIPFFFILCRPFSQYWALPVSNPQCANYHDYCIIQLVFNVSSDLLMLLLPLPFILNARVPPAKRLLLISIFSLGIFVMVASILNKYYNFTMPNTTVYMVWHIRETSTSVYVANIMCLWPLLRKIFGWKRFLQRSSNDQSGAGSSNRRSDMLTPDPNAMGTPLTNMKGNRLSPYSMYDRDMYDTDEKGRDIDIEVGEVDSIGRAL